MFQSAIDRMNNMYIHKKNIARIVVATLFKTRCYLWLGFLMFGVRSNNVMERALRALIMFMFSKQYSDEMDIAECNV